MDGVTPTGKAMVYAIVPFESSPTADADEANSTTKGVSVIIKVCETVVPDTALPVIPESVIVMVSFGSYIPSATVAITIPFWVIEYV